VATRPPAGEASLEPLTVGHAHHHDHGEGLDGGWEHWSGRATMRITVVAVAAAGLATVIAAILLWPTGEGRAAAIDAAAEFGAVSDRLSATVTEEVTEPCTYSTAENPQTCRFVRLIVNEGPEAGALVTIAPINAEFDTSIPPLAAGDDVILGYAESTNTYFFADLDRRGSLLWLALLFGAVVVALSRLRGVLALASMGITIVVLVGFVAPSVLDGNDPVLVCVVAASAIAITSLYLTHGLSPTTTMALAGTLAALLLTLGLSWVFFELASITGLGSEEALVLPFFARGLDISGLLLGGAIIGALGALDDVTVTQAATVAEMRRRQPDASTADLVSSGITIGREHIAATVNTLLLAYAGASMPLLLLFSISDQSLAMVANSEVIAVEIVRTLCGSIGLVAAVPLTTVLAAIATSGGSDSSADGPTAMPSDDTTDTPVVPPRWEDFAPDEDDAG